MFTCIFIYENTSVNLGMNSADTLYNFGVWNNTRNTGHLTGFKKKSRVGLIVSGHKSHLKSLKKHFSYKNLLSDFLSGV